MSRGRGRPTDYDPAYNEQVTKLCLLGATNAELAGFFNVCEKTIDNWKATYPEFLRSIKEGKEIADSEVASKLYHRALGYSHDAVQIVADAKTGKEHIVPYTKHYPPDTAAAIFWLKNRRKADWRDKMTLAGDPDEPIEFVITETVLPPPSDEG